MFNLEDKDKSKSLLDELSSDLDSNKSLEDKYIVAEERLTTVFSDEKTPQDTLIVEEEYIAPQQAEDYIVKSQLIDFETPNLKPINISKEMRQSFLDYSMSVICARALPDARDGLKPVHRRILYSMHEQGILSQGAHKKSARIVGDVLGKYHPHGDAPVYEAMVRMAQDFSMRYPLIDGHGNFGSVDGDEPAAMRYTEARMSKIANSIVESLKKDTVDFVENYDGSDIEPQVLPTRIPNLLVNGATGIAVGMATSIPPHNLNEILSGVIALAKNAEITIEELMTYIPAPDFPTSGLILGLENVKKAYQTGKGFVTLRAKTHIEELKNGKKRLVVTEIPYMVNKARLVEKIAELVKTKALEGITDLRDESSMHGIRIVIDVRRDIFPEVLRNQLFKSTALQTNFPINFLALVNGIPTVLNLKQMLQVFLNHQIEIVTRRSQFDLDKASARAHILEGLKIAIHNIEDVISIIRDSNNDQMVHQRLSEKYQLSSEQTKAIIEMRLGRLTSLAIEKMNEELSQLKVLMAHLSHILNNFGALIELIIEELSEIKGKFSDNRKSEIVGGEISIDNEDLIPQKDIAITMSSKGYVKRVPLEQFQIQHRGGVGSKAMTTYEDDDVDTIITTNTHNDLLIFTSFGKVYRLRAYQLPELSKQAKGIPFLNLINIEKDEKVVALLSTKEYLPSQDLLTVTKQGIIKRTKFSEYSRINISGKRALGLKEGDALIAAMIVKENDDVIIGSSDGNVVRFDLSQVRKMGRTASGVKGISLNDKATVVGASSSSSQSLILSIGKYGFGKLTPLIDYRKTKRGAKGVKSINVKKAGLLKFVSLVYGHEDMLITTKLGITIRTNLTQVSRSSRGTKGVKIITLGDGNSIKSVDVINTQQIEAQVEEAIRKTQELKISSLT